MIGVLSEAGERTLSQFQSIIYLTIFPAIALIVILIGLVKPAALAPTAFEGCYYVDRGPTIELRSKDLLIADSRQAPWTVSYMFAKGYDLYVSGPTFLYRTASSKRRIIVTESDGGQIIHMLVSPRGGPQMLIPVDGGSLEVPRSRCPNAPTAKPPE